MTYHEGRRAAAAGGFVQRFFSIAPSASEVTAGRVAYQETSSVRIHLWKSWRTSERTQETRAGLSHFRAGRWDTCQNLWHDITTKGHMEFFWISDQQRHVLPNGSAFDTHLHCMAARRPSYTFAHSGPVFVDALAIGSQRKLWLTPCRGKSPTELILS